MRHRNQPWVIVLSMLLACSGGRPVEAAQTDPSPPQAPGLNIVLVEGEGAINNVKLRTAREMVVRVEDQNHKPVAGAAVAFTLPSQGAGGTFAHGSRLLTVLTDQNGQAVVKAMRPNRVLGSFKINVTASFQGQTATAAITQTNVLAGAASAAAGGAAAGGAAAGGTAAGGLSAGVIAGIVVGAAAVAAGVGVAVTRGGGSSAPTARVGAGGPVVVGGPR